MSATRPASLPGRRRSPSLTTSIVTARSPSTSSTTARQPFRPSAAGRVPAPGCRRPRCAVRGRPPSAPRNLRCVGGRARVAVGRYRRAKRRAPSATTMPRAMAVRQYRRRRSRHRAHRSAGRMATSTASRSRPAVGEPGDLAHVRPRAWRVGPLPTRHRPVACRWPAGSQGLSPSVLLRNPASGADRDRGRLVVRAALSSW